MRNGLIIGTFLAVLQAPINIEQKASRNPEMIRIMARPDESFRPGIDTRKSKGEKRRGRKERLAKGWK